MQNWDALILCVHSVFLNANGHRDLLPILLNSCYAKLLPKVRALISIPYGPFTLLKKLHEIRIWKEVQHDAHH